MIDNSVKKIVNSFKVANIISLNNLPLLKRIIGHEKQANYRKYEVKQFEDYFD